jgi:hypothetical protein
MLAAFGFGVSLFSVRSASAFSASSFDQSERKTRICFPSSPTVTKPQALRFVRWPGTVQVRCLTFAMICLLVVDVHCAPSTLNGGTTIMQRPLHIVNGLVRRPSQC